MVRSAFLDLRLLILSVTSFVEDPVLVLADTRSVMSCCALTAAEFEVVVLELVITGKTSHSLVSFLCVCGNEESFPANKRK